jgi:hypothetical protein
MAPGLLLSEIQIAIEVGVGEGEQVRDQIRFMPMDQKAESQAISPGS